MFRRALTIALIVSTLPATATLAQDEQMLEQAIKARQAHMDLNAFNLGVLGAMAQGKMSYDADAASAAAGNLLALAEMSQAGYWPEGSDTMMDNTAALPDIWENMDDFMAKNEAMLTAATAMNDAAGQGLEALQGQMRDLGGACAGCHRNYRQRDN